jgi:nucleoside-diphosphate-sugar epimerase
MRILILGGTAFLSAEIARQALASGHNVTCLARGSTAEPPAGSHWIKADRSEGAEAYSELAGEWDAVIEVARDPDQARTALESLGDRAAHWTFVSSCSVYADHSVPGAGEDARLLDPLPGDTPYSPEVYGEAKSAIEWLTIRMRPAHLCRAGLISGPGDGTDRYGYWPARFARAAAEGAGPVLVPDIPDAATQVIDVRDLAKWILYAAQQGITEPLNAVGAVVPFREYLEESQRLTGATSTVKASEDWLINEGVSPWSGQDSLPLWLPPDHEGFCAHSNSAAAARGLTLRPWQDTLRDTLDDERRRGLGRERKAGLSPGTERRLVAGLLEAAKSVEN